MEKLYVTVHLGGGAGKAIVGLATDRDAILVLEEPQKDYWVNEAKKKNIPLHIGREKDITAAMLSEADVVIVNWWGHPLMNGFLADFPEIPCRLLLWSHVNGCVYPYLPYGFLDCFDRVAFTTAYSYENPLWTEAEKTRIIKKSAVVYGMGEFDPESYRAKEDYNIHGDLTVGYVGTINYAKLNPDFIRFCEAAAEKIPKIRFVMVGDPDEEIARDIESSSIADRFTLTGYTEHVEEWYLQFDVLGYLLNGYNYATTENVLLEAMAHGLPIVALAQPVEKTIIKSRKNGILIRSPAEYADTLERLCQSETLRKTLGNDARRNCKQNYSFERNKRQMDDLCAELCQEKKTVHAIAILKEKQPHEWLQYFLQNGYIERQVVPETVCTQKSKGSVGQYLQYYPDDEQLKQSYVLKGEKI